MVEMVETARILNTATDRSLVILDEIGRGTSTYDGVSLAWSIAEHIHDDLCCRTLFATHYHELTQLSESHSGVVNLNVSVKEWQDKVVFLHKIVPGSADKSYGIHVAKLAGVPRDVTARAGEILTQLESQHVDSNATHIAPKRKSGDFQLTLFETTEHPVVDEIRKFRIDEAAPLQALQQIKEWQDHVLEKKPY
jgi:DNA mismatch repair protein MutS